MNRRRPVARTYVALKQSFKVTRLKAEVTFLTHVVTTKNIDTTKSRRRRNDVFMEVISRTV
jgi:hypothetical protein